MIKQENHITALLLADRLKVEDKSLCYVASTNAEALMISKELSLYLNNNQIQYFPENEILPYDHFSSPESIIKNRFSILNETNKKKIYEVCDFYRARKIENENNSIIFEIAGASERINRFIKEVNQITKIEIVRSGPVAISTYKNTKED